MEIMKRFEVTAEHIGKMVEVSNNEETWHQRRLLAILPEDIEYRFVCQNSQISSDSANWKKAVVEVQKTYIELQQEYGPQVGDTVIFERTWHNGELGACYQFYDSMKKLIGKKGSIQEVRSSWGCRVRFLDGTEWWLPFFVLKKVSLPKPGTAGALKEGEIVATERGYFQILPANAKSWDVETSSGNPADLGWLPYTHSKSPNVKGKRLEHPSLDVSPNQSVVHVDNANGLKFVVCGIEDADKKLLLVKCGAVSMKFKLTDLLVVE